MNIVSNDNAEEERYEFKETNVRVFISANIKRHSNDTRHLWRQIQNKGWSFMGVVRDWTAVFTQQGYYMVWHHFVDDQPNPALIGDKEEGVHWGDFFERVGVVGSLLAELETMGLEVFLPVQAFTDAYIQDMSSFDWDWHLESPKHKILVWALSEKLSFLVEVYLDMPIAPYGVKEKMAWPDLTPVPEYFQESLFEFDEGEDVNAHPAFQGETMGILEEVDPELLENTRQAIRKIMTENDRVVLAFSAGKDSTCCLLLVLEYLLEHPDCDTEFSILSSDTGVENPVIASHLLKMKESIESLNLNIPFYIVRPDVENNYLTRVFGAGYSPPSPLFKWCVSRLKILPSIRELEWMVHKDIKTCLILGTRVAESQTRSRSVNKHFGENFYGTHQVKYLRTAAPIREWSATDVVTYLVRHPAPWSGYGNFELINLYGSAGSFGECPVGAAITSENEAIKSCSGTGSRFGCWSCTVVRSDESLKNMTFDYPELEPYYQFRQILKSAQDIRYGGNVGFQRISPAKLGSGIGDLTIDIRTIMLERMKSLGIPMSEDEVIAIYRMVKEREIKEGIPVTRRFREALFSFLDVHPGVIGAMYDSIWDPWNCGVDRFTQEDIKAIERIQSQKLYKV